MGLNGSSQCGVWSVRHRIRSWFYVQSRGISDLMWQLEWAVQFIAVFYSFTDFVQQKYIQFKWDSSGTLLSCKSRCRMCGGGPTHEKISVYPSHLQLREDFRWRGVIMIGEILRCCTVLKVVLINRQRQLLSSRLLKISLLNLTIWLLLIININGYFCATGGFWLLL